MPRSNRPRRAAGGRAAQQNAAPEDLDLERARSGFPHRESAPDGEWMVRPVTARNAAKIYTCPGCHRPVQPGVAHLVVWQEDSLFGAASALTDRRHWHTNCWQSRSYKYR
ncbi:ATP/GTP-binding protein [Paenarthrobacter sp. PH39-S1]|uniref:ATP/GTP-binding protein n=1 Tax=Micrococcaceae TaxID=1268 RepID=UPI0024BBA19F|nr:ATP/GTP-binding protein [Paenarthrobacter sp. PH39-S1]MDJ0357193.1 ATP/GTP-binding protein [Paenarthrobacter sp. PH39-S1]